MIPYRFYESRRFKRKRKPNENNFILSLDLRAKRIFNIFFE